MDDLLKNPITTQEELDNVIKERLARQEKKIRGEYEGFDDLKSRSDAWETEKAELQKSITDKDAAYKELEDKYNSLSGSAVKYQNEIAKVKAAVKAGLPMDMLEFVKGSTEEEINESAAKLAAFQGEGKYVPPLAEPSEGLGRDDSNGMRTMLKKMRGDE